MTRVRAYSSLEFTARFDKSYKRLGVGLKEQCDEALMQLLTEPVAAGLHLKPIRPSNHYWEARIDKAHRLILLPEKGMAWVIDVVVHDDIAKWGMRR